MTPAEYLQFLILNTGNNSQLIKAYDLSNFNNSTVNASIRFFTESTNSCPSRRMARIVSNYKLPVYMYSFDHVPRHSYFTPFGYVTHFAEVPFLFGMPDGIITCFVCNVALYIYIYIYIYI